MTSVQIHSATISTYGERFVDVFYVKDVFGLKIDSARKLDEIRGALMAALGVQANDRVKAKETP